MFPLINGTKRPAVSWGDYMFFRANDAQLERWSNEYENLGIITGSASGIVVVDIDNDDAYTWCNENGGLPSTVTIKTPRGYHLYYAQPNIPISNSASKLASGVDIRGDGGFVVGPESSFIPTKAEKAKGKVAGVYYPVPNMGPGQIELAPLPSWIIDHLTRHAEDDVSTSGKIDTSTTPVEIIVATDISEAYAAAVLRGELDRIREAGKGTRNDAVFKASDRIARLVAVGAINETIAKQEIRIAALAVGQSSEEITETIKSGFRHGLSKPKMLETAAPKMSAAMARKLLKKSKGNK
jgi:putative DNA primase/helicase